MAEPSTTMRASMAVDGQIDVQQLPIPEAEGRNVLIKVRKGAK